MLEWAARIRCDQYELGGSFSVLIFIGSVPDDPKQWETSESCVGIYDVYTGKPSDSPGEGDAEVQGFVSLNEGILKHSGASTLTPDVVVPFLTSELNWRVQNVSDILPWFINRPALKHTVT